MPERGLPSGLAALIGDAAAALPQAQARMDALAAPAALRHRASAELLAVVGPPMVTRIGLATIELGLVATTDRRIGAAISAWPLSIGFSVLHGVATTQAARIAVTIRPVSLPAAA